MLQLTNHILMIRPSNFGYNAETAQNNAFQTAPETKADGKSISQKAIDEFDAMVNVLRSHDIHVMVIEDTPEPIKPDAIFPNNWISTHHNGTIITYPMWASNRRIERREDIIEALSAKYKVNNRYSFEFYEEEDEPLFLEGTGSMIIDHIHKIVYACSSQRTDARLLDKFSVLMGMDYLIFEAKDENGQDIYHTNVMMALGRDFAVVCLEAIQNEVSKNKLISTLENTGKKIIPISLGQMAHFAGNMLEVLSNYGTRYLVMSSSAYDVLTEKQRQELSSMTHLLPISIPTIETYGGGSVRCMMAEIFLPKK